MRTFIITFFTLLMMACTNANNDNQQGLTEETSVTAMSSEETQPIQEAVSFMGEPLYRKTVDGAIATKSDSIIQAVRAKAELTEDDYHKIGLAYIMTYQFRDAIDVYTEGLEQYPESFQLLRHRGHRYLNVREREKAIIDLMKADELIGDQHLDVMEYNSDGSEKGTFKFWVWYHVALYRIFNQQWEEAAEAYQVCLNNAALPNNVSGASAWLYTVYQKMGESEKAEALIAPLDENFGGDQDYIYFKRIMLYQGKITPEDLMDMDKPIDQWTGRDMTIAYGIADWYEQQGNTEKAQEIYHNILATPHWNPWAYVVTESIIADLA
ncbi:MAG: tetratricopeptide repeat protein [Cyclobacteriaceae bacterium]